MLYGSTTLYYMRGSGREDRRKMTKVLCLKQNWSGSPGKSQSYQASIQCWTSDARFKWRFAGRLVVYRFNSVNWSLFLLINLKTKMRSTPPTKLSRSAHGLHVPLLYEIERWSLTCKLIVGECGS